MVELTVITFAIRSFLPFKQNIKHVRIMIYRDLQLVQYASWMPGINLVIIDCISISWNHMYIYPVSSFSIIWPTIKKVSAESEKALIIVPMWPPQIWFTSTASFIVQPLIIHSLHLHLSGTKKRHPLHPKLNRLAYSA